MYNRYNCIEKKMSAISNQKIPLYYMLAKDLPDIIPLSFPLSESCDNCTVFNMADICTKIDEETELINTDKGDEKGFV